MRRICYTLLISLVCLILLCACGTKPNNSLLLKESCWKRVQHMKVMAIEPDDMVSVGHDEQVKDKAMYQVTLVAPDYERIIRMLSEQGHEFSLKSLDQMIDENPELVMQYSFFSQSDHEDDIRDGFMDQVVVEMLKGIVEESEEIQK